MLIIYIVSSLIDNFCLLDLDSVKKLPESKPPLQNRRRMRRMSTFKDVIEDTIKKNRIIKQITFSIEARERNNPPRRLKSPPPPSPADKESSEEEETENDIVDIEKKIVDETSVKQAAGISTMKPTRVLKHSASFYFSKDCSVSKAIPTCPPTPMMKANSCVVGM